MGDEVFMVDFSAHWPEGFTTRGSYTFAFATPEEATEFVKNTAKPAWEAHGEALGGRILVEHEVYKYARVPF